MDSVWNTNLINSAEAVPTGFDPAKLGKLVNSAPELFARTIAELLAFAAFLALFAGLVLKLRPTLLPYFMIVHALMDLSAVSVYLMI